VAVIARVPFDEGHWPARSPWKQVAKRRLAQYYFVPENLKASVEHANDFARLSHRG